MQRFNVCYCFIKRPEKNLEKHAGDTPLVINSVKKVAMLLLMHGLPIKSCAIGYLLCL